MKINTPFNRWFCFCLLFIVLMIAARIIYSGRPGYIFLLWNLFLAWIPFVFSGFFESLSVKAKWKQLFLFGSWLLFFPNALYIVTDIIHLRKAPPVPLWFDAVLLFMVSFAGLALAFASLRNAESFLQKYFSRKRVSWLVPALLFAGSFGVYLGRFKRWNSWDIINEPITLVADVLKRFIDPVSHLQSWAIVFFLTILYSICWYFLKAFGWSKMVSAESL